MSTQVFTILLLRLKVAEFEDQVLITLPQNLARIEIFFATLFYVVD